MTQLFGTLPNQVPTNADLGTMAYRDQSQFYNVGQTVGFRNRIINGACVIDQRNSGNSVTPTSNTYNIDRWKCYVSQASKLTVQQNAGSVTPPPGFSNYLGVTSSSAYTVASGDFFNLCQIIEGYNIADLAMGTANAKPITVSFWVRSSLTGTFGGAIFNGAVNRSFTFSYVITTANTWQYVTITIPGDVTGTWTTSNAAGMFLNFSMGTGSTYTAATGTWYGSEYDTVTGQVNLVGTSGATWYVTGVQLEVGTQATSFDYRPYTTELQLCQRYYEQNNGGTTEYIVPGGYVYYGVTGWKFTVPKRTAPSVGSLGVSLTNQVDVFGTGSATPTSLQIDSATIWDTRAVIQFASSGNPGQPWSIGQPLAGKTAFFYANAEI